ncbi:MAG: hypothetical protein U0X39_13835 [Bacteroidales bacterium]
MKKYIYYKYWSLPVIALFTFLFSCDKFPDPSVQSLRSYYMYFINQQNLRLPSGSDYPDSIKIGITNYVQGVNDELKVVFEVKDGGGSVTQNTVYPGTRYIAATKWKLGTASFKQTLKATLYDSEGTRLTSIELVAYGFGTEDWENLSSNTESGITCMATDTINKVTFIVSYGALYKQGTHYYDWTPVSLQSGYSVRSIVVDSDGVFYVSNWNGQLYRSPDHGASWLACAKPFPDSPYQFYMRISKDKTLWAFNLDYPTVYSKDGGQTWITAGTILSKNSSCDMYPLSNGNLLFHTSACCSLYLSTDYGQTATKIATPPPGYSYRVYADNNDNFIILTQINGVSLYRSTNMGTSFTEVFNAWPAFMTTSETDFVLKWKSWYYVVLPGYGIVRSKDLVSFQDYYQNQQIFNFFIDHNGVIIAKMMWQNTIFYKKID